MRGLQLEFFVLQARRKNTQTIPEHRRTPRFIVRDPMPDPITQTAREHLRVLLEGVHRVTVWPSTLVLECLWEIPVVHRQPRRDATLQ